MASLAEIRAKLASMENNKSLAYHQQVAITSFIPLNIHEGTFQSPGSYPDADADNTSVGKKDK